jgi:hypothetical protein
MLYIDLCVDAPLTIGPPDKVAGPYPPYCQHVTIQNGYHSSIFDSFLTKFGMGLLRIGSLSLCHIRYSGYTKGIVNRVHAWINLKAIKRPNKELIIHWYITITQVSIFEFSNIHYIEYSLYRIFVLSNIVRLLVRRVGVRMLAATNYQYIQYNEYSLK